MPAASQLDTNSGDSKPRGVGTHRRASSKHSKAKSETTSDTSEDEGAAPQDCWLRPTLRPNRTLVIRNKYDSGSDTDLGAAADSNSAAAFGGVKGLAVPSRHSVIQALGDTELKKVAGPAAESDGEECRWGVRRRGPRETSSPFPHLYHILHP